jgi:hypothetical protein
MSTTSGSLPAQLRQYFDPFMLFDGLQRCEWKVKNKIIPNSHKKIRAQDVRKKREFDKLLKEFYEEYGRKKIEKDNYDAEIKEKIQKRPHLSNQGGIMRFKKMES